MIGVVVGVLPWCVNEQECPNEPLAPRASRARSPLVGLLQQRQLLDTDRRYGNDHHDQVEGQALREKLGLDGEALRIAIVNLSNALQESTGKKLDYYFLRKRVLKNGQRVKVYIRTKAGEKLIRDAHIA